MKRRLGCIVFTVLGVAWLAFVFFDMVGANMGDCGDDRACNFYRPFVSGMVIWRGLAVALVLILAYLAFRQFHKDEDVQ
jgi:hypothetical protein